MGIREALSGPTASARWKTPLKLVLIAALFYVLARKGLISVAGTGAAFSHPRQLGAAIALVFTTSLLAVVRWQWLLRAQKLELGWWRAFQLCFVGNFFNLALPGSVSGDVVKAFYASKESRAEPGQIFGTILFDRVVGISALVVVSAVALAANPALFGQTVFFIAVKATMIAGAIGVVAFYSYLFTVNESRDPLLALLKRLEARNARLGLLARTYSGLRHYHAHPLAVLRVFLLSALMHLIVCYGGILFAGLVGDNPIPAGAFFAIVPLGFFVTAVPVMPAGIGTGHAAFSLLFQALGSSHGADIFNLYIAVQLLMAAVGGLVYVGFRSAESASLKPMIAP